MTIKKRTWKFWTGRTLLVLIVLAGVWITNLIWFKPFSINHFYEKVFIEIVVNSPEITTQLGVPILYDLYKYDLDDISDHRLWEKLKKDKENYKTLLSYNFDKQSSDNQLNTQILGYYIKVNSVEKEPFFYYDYPANQIFGVQSNLPSMMVSSHKLNNAKDIKAYITRLSKFEIKFSQLLDNLIIRESKGIILPRFIIAILLDEMRGFVGLTSDSLANGSADPLAAVKSNVLYTHFVTKVDAINDIPEKQKNDYKNQVAEAIENKVFPAYQNIIDYFDNLYLKATNDAGVWKFPNGDNYYKYMLKLYTTTDLSPEEVYNIGISEVERIKEEMNAILLSEGYADSTKTIGEIILALSTEERFVYPNNDEGRQMIIAEYNRILEEISFGIGDAFDIFPKAGLEVKRMPEFKEEGSPFAYYEPPAMDGSRGGVFFTNLRAPHEVVKFGMKTLAYHEGIPGHHVQLGIQVELEGLPTFRTVMPFTAYLEGWALYTEQLAWELGFYENDPFGNLGRLQAEMFRAVRLVVDVGLHYKKWTREEAIDYMVSYTGDPTKQVITEIERYIVMPGQACAYKIGMLKILELRERTKQKLGDKFDLREFHTTVLKNGAVPLDILEDIINDYISRTLEKNSN